MVDVSGVPFVCKRLDHLVLRTENIEKLREFYLSLGCNVVRDLTKTLGLLQLRLGVSMLDLVDVHGQLGLSGGAAPASSGRNLDHFAVRVEPFDGEKILEFFSSKGVTAKLSPELVLGAEGYGQSVYIEDPDGNRIELKGPSEDL